MEKIFVCAGMELAKDQEINNQAKELGSLLAQNDVMYVQGGSTQGLMGLTLSSFLKQSTNVKFIIPSKYYNYDAPELEKLVGTKNFNAIKVQSEIDRLRIIMKCDRIIVLPGGTGTIEELLVCNETLRASEHNAKIQLININGYYDGFLSQLQTNIAQGLSKPSALKFDVYNNVNQLEFCRGSIKGL